MLPALRPYRTIRLFGVPFSGCACICALGLAIGCRVCHGLWGWRSLAAAYSLEGGCFGLAQISSM